MELFIQENASETIVCETWAILSRGRWVNGSSASPVYKRESYHVIIVPAGYLACNIASSSNRYHIDYSESPFYDKVVLL